VTFASDGDTDVDLVVRRVADVATVLSRRLGA
jgi:hypothetical protein